VVRALISETSETLAHIDHEILRAQALLDGLVRRRQVVTRRQEVYLSFAAPVRRIPPELRAEIFLCTIGCGSGI